MGNYFKQVKEAVERGHRFVTHDIWQIGEPGERIPSGIITKNIRVALLLLRGITEETLLLRASALTFATMLFIVPFLVFMFAFIQTFDLGDNIYFKLSQSLDERIEQMLTMIGQDDNGDDESPPEIEGPAGSVPPRALGGVAPRGDRGLRASSSREGPSPAYMNLLAELSVQADPDPGDSGTVLPGGQTADQRKRAFWRDFVGTFFPSFHAEQGSQELIDPVAVMVSMIESKATNLQTLGITWIFYILVTVLGFMRNVEWSFNKIWGVNSSRNIFRTISDYVIITLLLPIVMAAVLGITAALATVETNEFMRVALSGLQLAVLCLTFTAMYVFVPNTKVMFRYALLGGVIAGVIWVLNSWAFVNLQIGLSRNEFLFSTFALFPILLFWIYSSWIILLFGALIAFAYQNENTFAMERYADEATYAYREALAVRAFVEMSRRFDDGRPGYTVGEMAQAWNVPTRLLTDMLESLVAANLITPCATEPVTYQPARSPEKTRVIDIVHVVREAGRDPSLLRGEAAYKDLYRGLSAGEDEYLHLTIAALAQKLSPPEPPEETKPEGRVVQLHRSSD